jgi:hypothetical protein
MVLRIGGLPGPHNTEASQTGPAVEVLSDVAQPIRPLMDTDRTKQLASTGVGAENLIPLRLGHR